MKQADNNKKNRHLTVQDRQEIMNGLDKGLSFKAIALLVQKDPTTISYEVKRHRKEHRNAFVQTDNSAPCSTRRPSSATPAPSAVPLTAASSAFSMSLRRHMPNTKRSCTMHAKAFR